MFKSIRISLGLAFGFLVLIGLLSTGTTLWTVRRQSADALVINVAGRERMLSQRVAKLALEGVQHEQDASYVAQMHAAAHEWEQFFVALRDGGEVVYEGRAVSLPPTTDPLIRAQLERVWSLWQPFHTAAHAVLENPPGSPAFVQGLADLNALSESLLTEMDRAVQLYEAAAGARVAQVERIQLAFLIAGALVVAFGFGLVAWQIIRPLQVLGSVARRMAAGDLSMPVPLVAQNEIGSLAQTFEEMRQRLAASRAELERWAAELENRVAARTREITTLSAIVQVVNRHTEIEPLLAEALPLLCETVGASAAWVSLLDERGNFRLAGAHNLPPALEVDDRAEMRWLGCTCQRKLLAGELTAAANILECQRLQQARGDTRGLRYHASIPLRARDRVLGLLNLTTVDGRVFSDDELRLLSAISAQIAVAIERARLYEQTKARHIEEQATLLNLSQALLGETEAQAIMDQALRVAAESLQVEFAAIALIDADGQHFSGRAGIGWPPEILQQAQRIPLTASTGLAYAIRTQAPVVIPDESREKRFGAPPWIAQMGIASSLLVPMFASGEAVGGLVVNSRTPRAWSEDEVRLLALIANDTALALERARLYADALERLERITALHEIDVAIAANLSLEQRLNVLLEKVTERLRVDAAAIAFIEPETRKLRYAARRGLNDEFFTDSLFEVEGSIAGQVAQTGELIAISDVRTEPRFVRRAIAERLGLVSYLAVPLRGRGGIIGVLELATRQPHLFPQEEIDFFVTLAGQAAIAIENARLFEAEHAAREQAETLLEVAQIIGSSLELDKILARILEQLKRLIVFDTASLLLIGEEGGVDLIAGIGYADEAFTSRQARGLLKDSRILQRMARDLQPVVIPDVRTHPDWIWVPGAEHVRSFLCVPMVAQERMIGALMMDSARDDFYTEVDVRIARALAQHLAVVIENARLYQETARRLRELELLHHAALAVTQTPDLDAALDQVVRRLADELGYRHVAIGLVDAAGERVNLGAQSGIPLSQWGPGNQGIRVGQGLVGWVAQHGEALLVNDVSQDPRYLVGIPETRAELVVPLRVGERTIGVINVESPSLNAFGASDLQLLSTLAGQIANAIEKARLFQVEQARREEIAALYDLSRALAEVPYDFDSILNLVARRAVETVRVTFARIALIEDGECVVRAAYPIRVLDRDMGVGRREMPQALPTCYRVAQQDAPVVLRSDDPALGDLEREALFLGLARSLCLVPLRASERPLGLMMLGEMRREEREPFTAEKIRLARSIGDQAASALHRAELFAELERAYLQTVLALANAVDAKDTYTADHAQRLAQMALAVGRQLGMNAHELEDLRYGAILHDIGKIGVPDQILKKPTRLETQEWEIIRQHPLIGAKILEPVTHLTGAARIVRHHHERYDGTGYPDGLAGEAIPLGARILAVVDAYCAIKDERVYKRARSHEEAVAELKRCAGSQFDPHLVEIFLQLLERGMDTR